MCEQCVTARLILSVCALMCADKSINEELLVHRPAVLKESRYGSSNTAPHAALTTNVDCQVISFPTFGFLCFFWWPLLKKLRNVAEMSIKNFTVHDNSLQDAV